MLRCKFSDVVDARARSRISVTAVTQHLKDDVTYARVDDEATIILTYANAQAIIQGSWNWPDHRKDLEIFGAHGYVFTPDSRNVRMRLRGEPAEKAVAPEQLDPTYQNCFAYLAAVIRGEIEVLDTDRSSLANNLIVVRILEAARRSAQSRQTIVSGTLNARGRRPIAVAAASPPPENPRPVGTRPLQPKEPRR